MHFRLCSALANRDQLGLDLAAAFDRQADGVRLRASGHCSGISPGCASRGRSRDESYAAKIGGARRKPLERSAKRFSIVHAIRDRTAARPLR
jgi:hypothetical protein